MTTCSSIIAWKIPWTGESGYSPGGLEESDMTEWLSTHTHIHIWCIRHSVALGFLGLDIPEWLYRSGFWFQFRAPVGSFVKTGWDWGNDLQCTDQGQGLSWVWQCDSGCDSAHLCSLPRGSRLQPYRCMGHRIRELAGTADTSQSRVHCASGSLGKLLQKAGARTPLPESLAQAALEGPRCQCV